MKLFFRKYGEGPPLILLHGLFGMSDNWIHIARGLEEVYTVYLPDLRNHGLSPWSSMHNYNVLAEDILDLADEQGLERFFVAGHSMGGKTALHCAVKAPERIFGLFVGDINPFSYNGENKDVEQFIKILKIITTVDPSTFTDRNQLEDHLVITAGETVTRYVLSKNIAIKAGKMFWKLNAVSLISNMKYILEGFPRPPHHIKVTGSFPVVFLRGGKSSFVSADDIKDITVMFPDARIITSEKSGHWIHTEIPDEVIRAIKAMKELSGREDCN